METKICKKCGIEKKLCEYNCDKYSSDGLRYRCRECTSNEYREFYNKNREKEIIRQISYQKNNTDQVKSRRNVRHNKKYQNDIFYRLKTNLRNRVKLYFSSSNFDIFTNKTFDVVGCTPQELKKHLESHFDNNMSWENYGHKGWHIDHIIPLSSAKCKEDVYKLCHYSNLQPLWCEENYKKGNKIYEDVK